MVDRHIVREGIAAEQRRQAVLAEAARHRLIVESRGADASDPRPFAAPGSFLVYLKRHLTTARFRPARPAQVGPASGVVVR